MKVARVVVLGFAETLAPFLALQSLAVSRINAPRTVDDREVRRTSSVDFVRYGIPSIQSAN